MCFYCFSRAFLWRTRSPACMCRLLIDRPVATHGVACSRNDVRADCLCNSKTDMDIQLRRVCEWELATYVADWQIAAVTHTYALLSLSLCDLGPRNAQDTHAATHSPTFYSDVGDFFFFFQNSLRLFVAAVLLLFGRLTSGDKPKRKWETMVALLPHYYLNRIELKSSRKSKYSTHFSEDVRIEIVIFHVCASARLSRCRWLLCGRVWVPADGYVCGVVFASHSK